MAEGTPEQVAEEQRSLTGRYLRKVLKPRRAPARRKTQVAVAAGE